MDGASIGKPTEGWINYSPINDKEVLYFVATNNESLVKDIYSANDGSKFIFKSGRKFIFRVGANREWIVEYDSKGKEVAWYNVDHISEIRWAKEK